MSASQSVYIVHYILTNYEFRNCLFGLQTYAPVIYIGRILKFVNVCS